MTRSVAAPAERVDATIPRSRVATLAATAVAFAFLLVLLPGPHRHGEEIGAAAGIGLLVVALALLWERLPVVARVGSPIAYVAMVSVLVDGSGGTSSGLGGLFLLPMLWLAIVGSRRELVAGMVAVFIARALPVRIVGEPTYPPSEWRWAIVLGAVAMIACFTIQKLVHDARARAAELRRRAAELEVAAAMLERQNAELRELDHLKDEFLRLVSHELRTPLTSIIGYLEIVTDPDAEPLSEAQRTFLGTASRNAERLRKLIEDLLFLVQVDSGRLELHRSEVDVAKLLAEVAAAARPAAEAKGVALAVDAGDLRPAVCDRPRIALLLENLVSNAVKFTPEGGSVTLRARQEPGGVAVTVQDTGIGIPADEQARLFGRFFRAEGAIADAAPGTGLGLAVAQALAEAHGTRITVQSAPGVGSAFSVLLPR